MLKLLGALDIIAAVAILALHFFPLYFRIPLLVSIYVIVKWFFFKDDFLSYLDLILGLYVWVVFLYPTFLDFMVVLYFLYKGIISFF